MPKKCEHCKRSFTPGKRGQRFCRQACNYAHRPTKYPWGRWFSKRSFTVKAGDYTCRMDAMMTSIRNKAVSLGKRVSLRADRDGTIHVQVKS